MLRTQCAVILVILSQLGTAQAGNIGTLTNFSAHYLRTLSRAASTDLDAAHYNMAGLAHTEDGFGINLTHVTWFRLDRLNYDGQSYETRKWPQEFPGYNPAENRKTQRGYHHDMHSRDRYHDHYIPAPLEKPGRKGRLPRWRIGMFLLLFHWIGLVT